jgi:hypothetical protein
MPTLNAKARKVQQRKMDERRGKGGKIMEQRKGVRQPVTQKQKGKQLPKRNNDNVASKLHLPASGDVAFKSQKSTKTFSQAKVIQLLLNNNGMITKVATIMGCSFVKLKKYIEENEKVKDAINTIDDAVIEEVESHLMDNIKGGNVAAQIFFLKTRGKKKGYIEDERADLSKLQQPVQITFVPPPGYVMIDNSATKKE